MTNEEKVKQVQDVAIGFYDVEAAKDKIISVYQLTLDKGWYWQKKENMSPWKVFSENHLKERSIIWLMFRVHKLCVAKYLYFVKELDNWQPVTFQPDRMIRPNTVYPKDWVMAEAYLYKPTGRIITITKLQQITNKNVFETWIAGIEAADCT